MLAEYAAVRQDRVEVLDDSAIPLDATQVCTPEIKAEREKVGKQRALDLCVPQIVYVLPQVVRLRLFARLESNKAAQMAIVSFKSLLSDLVRRHNFSIGAPERD
jgi:hypothetical protein